MYMTQIQQQRKTKEPDVAVPLISALEKQREEEDQEEKEEEEE